MKRILASLILTLAMVAPSLASAAPIVLPPLPTPTTIQLPWKPTSGATFKVDTCKHSVKLDGGVTIGVYTAPICPLGVLSKFELPFSTSMLCSNKLLIKTKAGVDKTTQFQNANCNVLWSGYVPHGA